MVEDDLGEVASAVVAAYESGELQEAVDGGHDSWQGWVKGLGKGMKRKVMPEKFSILFIARGCLGIAQK